MRNRSKSAQFRTTADRVKKINVAPYIPRGGIRL